MAKVVFLDTHVVVWLYSGNLELFSPKSKALMESHDLLISPMVELELTYLKEIKKIAISASDILAGLATEIGLKVDETSFPKIAKEATQHHWTRDPFDRIIAATAQLSKAKLITKDQLILKHCTQAVWE